MTQESNRCPECGEAQWRPSVGGEMRSCLECGHVAVVCRCPKCLGGATPSTPVAPDNPELDATDAAHPAWWRGYAYGTDATAKLLTEVLDGTRDPIDYQSAALTALADRLHRLHTAADTRRLREAVTADDRDWLRRHADNETMGEIEFHRWAYDFHRRLLAALGTDPTRTTEDR